MSNDREHPAIAPPANSAAAPTLRLWPAVLIVLGVGITAALLWIPGVMDQAKRNLSTQILALIALLTLTAWLLLFSRLAGRLRVRLAVAIAALVGLFLATVRMEGLSGDLWFDWGWRCTAQRDTFQDAAGTADLAAVTPHDYPQYLGPRRNASDPNSKLQADWQAHPPRELWRHEMGPAWSAFAVVGEFAVTQEQLASGEAVTCYELKTGKPVWKFSDPDAQPRVDDLIGGDGPRATPTIAAGRVYALGPSGTLNCLNGSDGSRDWSRQIHDDAAAQPPHWGYSGSPLIANDLVIVSAGGPEEKSLLAYHANDGSLAWHAGQDRAAYASPLLLTLSGVPQVVSMNKISVTSHDPADGKILWTYDWKHDEQNCASPLQVDDGRILVSSGYGFGAGLIAPARGDDGAWTVTEVWRHRELKSKFANLLVHDGHIYGLDDGIFTCLELETGKRKWKKGRYGHGQLLLVGGLIVVQAEAGEVVLVEPSPTKLIELGRIEALSDKTWNNPAWAPPYLLVRNAREAVCFELPLAGQ